MRHTPGSVGRSVGMTDLPSEICVHETHLHFLACPRTFFVREHQKSVCSRANEQKWTNFAYFSSFLMVFLFLFFSCVFVNTARNKFSLCSRTKRAFPFFSPNVGDVDSGTAHGQCFTSQGAGTQHPIHFSCAPTRRQKITMNSRATPQSKHPTPPRPKRRSDGRNYATYTRRGGYYGLFLASSRIAILLGRSAAIDSVGVQIISQTKIDLLHKEA